MARKSTQQSLASWIFGGISFLFLIGVFWFAPKELEEAQHRILGLFAALCAAFLGYFLTGTIGIDGNTTLKPVGRFSIKAGGGLALFVLVLFWWNSDQSPSKVSKEIKKVGDKITAVGNLVKTEADRQRQQMDEVIRSVAELKARPSEQKLTDDEIWDRAKQSVAAKNGIALEKLQAGFDLFIVAVKADPNADFLDRARVDFAEKRFTASADNAGRAAETSEEKFRAAEKLAALAHAEKKARSTEIFQARKQQGLACVADRKYEKAVEAYRLAMRVVAREQMPEAWAEIQFLLGEASSGWAAVSEGAAIGQLRQDAVKAYRSALEVFKRETLPQDWGAAQNSLANVFCAQAWASEGDEKARLLSESVAAYRLALEAGTREVRPKDWATTQNNLANALSSQATASEGAERKRLLGEAVKAYQLALEVLTKEALPEGWAMTQNNLATALCYQAAANEGLEKSRLLGEAVKTFRKALQVYTKSTLPQDWAMTQNNLATTLGYQAAESEGVEKARLFGDAVIAYRLALEIRTREALPQDWATTQNNLANALRANAAATEGAERARLLSEAIVAYRLALEVRTREVLPQAWGTAKHNLGVTLYAQATSSEGAEKVHLLSEAVKAYRSALEVRTREASPQDWAVTKINLAIALNAQSVASEVTQQARLLGEAVQALRDARLLFESSKNIQNLLPKFLGNYSFALLVAHKPVEAAAAAEEALALAPSELWIATNQAHGYLLAGQFPEAVEIYRKYAAIKLDDKTTFAQAVLKDFAELRKAGVDHPDMAKIEAMLKAADVDVATR